MFASFGADGQLTTTTRRPSFCAELPSRWRLSPPPLNTCWFGVHSRRPGCRQQFNRRKEFSTDRLCRPTWSHRLFCPFQLASDHGRFHAEVGVRRLFCHDFPAFHSITLVAPRTVRASIADHFRCFCSAARHSIVSGFVCTFCRRFVLGLGEKQNAPANRSQTRKKIK